VRFILALLLILAFPFSARAEDGKAGGFLGKASVTVMPFTALEQSGEAWLGKAIADLVAQKLAASGARVLERDKLEAMLKEMELQQAGFADPAAVKRLGGLAEVDSVVYGNYELKGNSLTLHLLVMDMKTQEIAQKAEADGSADDLGAATSALVMDLLKQQGAKLGPAELKNIKFRATDSTPALEHFYKGIDDADRGKDEDAYGEFTAAAHQDPKYLDARLWSARMLEATGQAEQAVLVYSKLHDDAPNAVEGRDALFFAARLLEAADPAQAAADYRVLTALRPRIPEGLEAGLRLSRVLSSQKKYGEAYTALQDIQDFRVEADKLLPEIADREYHEERRGFFGFLHNLVRLVSDNRDELKPENERLMSGLVDLEMRQSRFFSWSRALDLYRAATINMIGLFRDAAAQDPALKPPRGVFAVDAAHPEIAEPRYGETKSLFYEDEKYVPGWSEKFYAAIMPAGMTAEGVTLEVSGMLPSPTATTDYTLKVFGFPLPRSYHNNWLGVIYGQTPEMETLRKDIAFHGRDQNILVFQLIENRSHIRDWRVSFRLKPEAAPAATTTLPAGKDFEGAEVARLSLHEDLGTGAAEPQYIEQFSSRKRLALLAGPQGGWVVAAQGSLHAGTTSLWGAYSADGKAWPELKRLNVNSQSSDFAPQLVRGEDGSARLFWLSKRRGLGWEIWTSESKAGAEFSEPKRIPIESFLHYSSADAANIADDLLAFAAMQDKQGRWLLAVCPTGEQGGAAILSSSDAENWQKTGGAPAQRRYFGVSLMQDAGGVYWLGAIDGGAEFHLLRSNDLSSWATHDYALGSYARHWSTPGNDNYSSVSEIAGYQQQLFDPGDGRVLLLFSDTVTGLQYALFNPETETPVPDLVHEIALEPSAVARDGNGWLAADWLGGDIVLRKYRHFAFPGNGKNLGSDPLYHETETDEAGNTWDRRIARTRYVMSDVTAVGATPGGRAWWGIETGVMSLEQGRFFVADVSMGFFFHQVTDIVSCGGKTWFSSRLLATPLLGRLDDEKPQLRTDKVPLPGLSGAVTAMTCAGGTLYVGTENGDIAAVQNGDIGLLHHADNAKVTALAARKLELWAGTAEGKLLRLKIAAGAKPETVTPGGGETAGTKAIAGLALGDDGTLWVATGGDGLYRFKAGTWAHFAPGDGAFPYASPGKLVADGAGVWFMPGPYQVSRGIGYFDGKAAQLYNPPSRNLFDIIDFDRAPDGSLWVGSESSGIYRFARKP
jgi:hypothetical protein